jgi:hypothetical protein
MGLIVAFRIPVVCPSKRSGIRRAGARLDFADKFPEQEYFDYFCLL